MGTEGQFTSFAVFQHAGFEHKHTAATLCTYPSILKSCKFPKPTNHVQAFSGAQRATERCRFGFGKEVTSNSGGFLEGF